MQQFVKVQNYEFQKVKKHIHKKRTDYNILQIINNNNNNQINPLLLVNNQRNKNEETQIEDENKEKNNKSNQKEQKQFFNYEIYTNQNMSDQVENQFTSQIFLSPNSSQEFVKKILKSDYLKQIQIIKKQMVECWKNQDKVQSLQKVVQCVKLLGINDDNLFYALKFQEIIKIVLKFSNQVYNRILEMQYGKGYKKMNIEKYFFNPKSRNIIKNWFQKVGSIREMLPRIYIQASFLKIFNVIEPSRVYFQIHRMTILCRAIGDKQSSLYYLFFLMFSIHKTPFRDDIDSLFDVYLNIFKEIIAITQNKNPISQFDDIKNTHLIEPVLQIFYHQTQQLHFSNNQNLFQHLLQYLVSQTDFNYIILYTLLQNLDSNTLVNNIIPIINIINQFQGPSILQTYILLLQKIKHLNLSINNKQLLSVQINNAIVKHQDFILQLKLIIQYILTINLNIQPDQQILEIQQFIKGMNNFFKQIDSIDSDKQKEAFKEIQNFIYFVIKNSNTINDIQLLDPFIQIIQFFPAQIQVKSSKIIVEAFIKNKNLKQIDNPQVINKMIHLIKQMDYKNQEQEYFKKIIVSLIERINVGQDYELYLNIMIEFRKNFVENGLVIEYLINQVIRIIIKIKNKSIDKGKKSEKVRDFLKSCIAFCHITVSCIENEMKELRIYNEIVQIALQLNLISQAESIIKNIVRMISSMSLNNDQEVSSFNLILNSFIYSLILFPNNPEKQPHEIVLALFNAIEIIQIHSNSIQHKLVFYSKLLIYYALQYQQNLPFNFLDLISNDQIIKDQNYFNNLDQNLLDILQIMIDLSAQLSFSEILNSQTTNELLQILFILQQYFIDFEYILTLKTNILQFFLKYCASKTLIIDNLQQIKYKINKICQFEQENNQFNKYLFGQFYDQFQNL